MANYLTQDDVNNFGGKLIDVVQRGALHAVGPALNRLEQENEVLRDHVAREVQRNLHQQVEREVPNWREINADPRWLQWLSSPDSYSGYRRQNLLNDATEKGDAGRAVRIFKGFIAEVSGQPGQPGQAALPRSAVLPSGRIYTRDQITQMARLRQKGAINDADWRRWEYELCRASKEGRVRGALSLDDGLPVTR